jgi:hypothetical protein
MHCTKCGYTSDRSIFFRSQKGTPLSYLCLACDCNKVAKGGWFVVWLFIGLLCAGIILLYVLPSTLMGPMLINLAVFQFMAFSSLVLHELGHVAGAFIGSLKVLVVSIGHGDLLWEFRSGGVHWTLRELPYSGYVLPGGFDPHTYKASMAVCILGGPFANAAVLLFAFQHMSWDKSLTGTDWDHVVPVTALALVNAFYLICSLWPFGSADPTRANTDGALLYKILRLNKKEIETNICGSFLYQAEQLRNQRQYENAIELLAEAIKKYPANLHLQLQEAYLWVHLKQYATARERYLTLLEKTKDNLDLQSGVLNNIAFVNVLLSNPLLLAEADDFSLRAITAFPDNKYYQATRGVVLMKLDKVAEGLPLLESTLKGNHSPEGTALNLCFMAESQERSGNANAAREFYNMARRINPDCFLLEKHLLTEA